MPVVPECFLASGKTHGEEQKNTYVTIQTTSTYTLCELTQQSPSCTQTLEQQATGGMNEVGQESEVAIKSPYISRLISDAWQLTASLCCGFMSALTLMSLTLLFIHSLLSKLLTRLSFMCVRC